MNKSNFNLPKTFNEYYYINNNSVNNYKYTHSSTEHSIEYILPPKVTREDVFEKIKICL